MPLEDQILLKLVIKGMDPAEVQQLAASTQGELNARIKTYLDQLVGLHRAASDATTKDAKKAAQDQIDILEQQIDAVAKVGRAHEIAANRASANWRRTAEDLENITTVATGVIEVMTAGWERFKKFGEEIVRDTQIYEGLHGSIDAMRKSTQGEIADIDLVSAKNRGFQKELKLTDEQYGEVAAAAKKYADVTGTNVKDALDGLIDGLATGRTKMLQHVGIMVDAKKAAEDYAEAHGLVVDKLTDEEKILATQEAAMIKITDKTKEFGEQAVTVASTIERAFAAVKNAIVGAAVAIGSIKVTDGGREYSASELEAMKRGDALIESRTGRNPGNYEAMLARQAAFQASEKARADSKSQALYDSEFNNQGLAGLNDEGQGEQMKRLQQMHQGVSDKELAKLKSKKADTTYFPFGQEGEDFDETKHKAKDETDYGIWSETPNEERDPKAEAKILAEFMDHKKKMEEVIKATGGPLMAQLLFGPDGPKQTLQQMDEFTRAQVEAMNLIAETGQKMALAMGSSIAASIAGDKTHAKSIKQATHDVLEGLAAQAIGYALMQAAMGVASLAMYDYPGAVLHFKSAAMFGAIGVVSGLGARAVGEDSTAAGAAKGTSSSGGAFNTPRSSSTSSTTGDKPAITVNLTVWPGGEAEAGRQVAKALGAYTRESGQSIVDLTTGKAAA